MKRLLAILLIMTIALPVCAKKHKTEEIITAQTQLEKRSYQSRTFQSHDQIAVMKSILNVLQDDGYLVYNVNSLLGFIYAVKDFDINDPNIDISKEFGLTKSRLSYNGVNVATIETTANVTQFGEKLRVRINFKRKLLNQYGNAQFIDDVSDPEMYNEFYEKLKTAMELQKNFEKPAQAVKQPPTPKPQKKKKEVDISPDLMKEINNEVNKVITSDSPEIPAVSETAPAKQEEKLDSDKQKSSEKPVKVKDEKIKEEAKQDNVTTETQTQEASEEKSENKKQPKKEKEKVKQQENPPAENITENKEDNIKNDINEEKVDKKKNKKDKNKEETTTE